MAKQLYINAMVIINSINLSDHVKSLAIDMSTPQIDVTAMGATAKQYLAGFRDDSIDIDFWQDFAASSVDATLWPLFSGGSIFAVEFAGNGTAISATNPSYSGSAVMTDYPPLSGNVGDALAIAVKMKAYGALVRATS